MDDPEARGRHLANGNRWLYATHIDCQACGLIQPACFEYAEGNHTHGVFARVSEIRCEVCRPVIATTYKPVGTTISRSSQATGLPFLYV